MESGPLDIFQKEFVRMWGLLPIKGFFLALLAGWVALFHFLGNSTLGYVRTPSLFLWMLNAYHPISDLGTGSDDAHGMLIPLVVLGLFWWKRQKLIELPLRTWWPGLLLIGAGLTLHLLGYAVQQQRVSIVGLFVGIYGIMGLAWRPASLRERFFPFFLFPFFVPLGSL